MRYYVAFIAPLALLTLNSTAVAQVSVNVALSDLNLQSASGRQVAENRLELASKKACGSADIRDIARARAVKDCKRKAYGAALAELHQIISRPAVLATSDAPPPTAAGR